jgi:transcriptional regulator with GAF, ATPase, and Fis domain
MRLWNNIFTFNPQWYVDYLCGKMEDFSTLLLGATGTGKTLIAHTIGCSGFIPFDLNKNKFKESFTRSFQFINLSQYPSSLLESELFGHKKGAFTGAIDNHQGLFNRCSEYGAVFIDEIGDIDISTQVKLLNVIQDRTFSPVGSHEKLRFSGRVISATNRNISQLRKDGHFRDDLYYRLCSDVIEVPSLQQRIQENPKELSHLINRLLKRISNIPTPELAAMIEKQILTHVPDYYAWPGNVRELEQCIRRICLNRAMQYFRCKFNKPG